MRGEAAPADLELVTRWPRLDETGTRLLEVWLRVHHDARLIIIDTLAKVRGRARSGSLYGEDYAALEGVQTLAHQYGVAILVIHHTGKESREDALDEVNATQGLAGVADNVLVLRRERGKVEATLVGDGRELLGVEHALRFDLTTGAWSLTEPPAETLKTPERTEILRLLEQSAEPMSPTQVAEALGKNVNTVRRLLTIMARAEEIKVASYGKYAAFAPSMNSVNSMNSMNSSEESSGGNEVDYPVSQSLVKKRSLQEFTEFTEFMGVPEQPSFSSCQDIPTSGLSIAPQDPASAGRDAYAPGLPAPKSRRAAGGTSDPAQVGEETGGTLPAQDAALLALLPPALRPKPGVRRQSQVAPTSLIEMEALLQREDVWVSIHAVTAEMARWFLSKSFLPEDRQDELLHWLAERNMPLLDSAMGELAPRPQDRALVLRRAAREGLLRGRWEKLAWMEDYSATFPCVHPQGHHPVWQECEQDDQPVCPLCWSEVFQPQQATLPA